MIRSTQHEYSRYGAHAQQLLGDTVFERLLADIMSGRFTPHERLRVDEIARELAVSRTPVREAITRLAWSGFVDVARNSHTQIANWNTADMRDRLRMGGELTLLALADERLDLRALRLASTSPEQLRMIGDTRAFLDLIEDITRSTWSCAVNRILEELHRPLRLYLRSPLLAQHGVHLAARSAERIQILDELSTALRAGNRATAHGYLEDYLADLVPAFAPS